MFTMFHGVQNRDPLLRAPPAAIDRRADRLHRPLMARQHPAKPNRPHHRRNRIAHHPRTLRRLHRSVSLGLRGESGGRPSVARG
jgi:hypothetical protein